MQLYNTVALSYGRDSARLVSDEHEAFDVAFNMKVEALLEADLFEWSVDEEVREQDRMID